MFEIHIKHDTDVSPEGTNLRPNTLYETEEEAIKEMRLAEQMSLVGKLEIREGRE